MKSDAMAAPDEPFTSVEVAQAWLYQVLQHGNLRVIWPLTAEALRRRLVADRNEADSLAGPFPPLGSEWDRFEDGVVSELRRRWGPLGPLGVIRTPRAVGPSREVVPFVGLPGGGGGSGDTAVVALELQLEADGMWRVVGLGDG